MTQADPPTSKSGGSGPEISWLGHATVDVRLGGARLLTDPVLRDRFVHLRRHDGTAEVEASNSAGPIDVVLISHLHHDHLDIPSLRKLSRDVAVVVPRGSARIVARHVAGEVVEMSPGEDLRVGDVEVTAVPAEHHRGRFMSRVKADPLGFVMTHDDGVVYFPGDTDLHPVMAELPAPDVALLPIWGWGRTLGDAHLDPGRAGEAAALLRARAVLPIHWGTFAPVSVRRGEPGWLRRSADIFEEQLRRHAPETHLELVRPGSSAISFGPPDRDQGD